MSFTNDEVNLAEIRVLLNELGEKLGEKKFSSIKSIGISEFSKVFYEHNLDYIGKPAAQGYNVVLKDLDEFLEYKIKVNELMQEHIDGYVHYIRKKNKETTVKNKVARLFTAINYAKESNYMSRYTDLKKREIPIVQVARKSLHEREYKTLVKNCEREDLRDVITIGYQTGMRISEIINLCWGDVSIENRYFSLTNKKFVTKTKRPRNIPLTSTVVSIISRRLVNRSDSEFVLTERAGRKWTRAWVSRLFKDLVEKVFGKNLGISFHSLRRSFITNMAAKGKSSFVIQKIVGHSSIATTQKYIHLDMTPLLEAIECMDIKDETIKDVKVINSQHISMRNLTNMDGLCKN